MNRPAGLRLTSGRVLGMLVILAGMALAAAWLLDPPEAREQRIWLAGVLVNLGAGVIGSCTTFFLIDMRLNQHAAREAHQARQAERDADRAHADRLRLLSLVARIRSGSETEARAAVEELRARGWLTDGSLSGADFSGACLRNSYLQGARLSNVLLRGADLRGADLTAADLTASDLRMADLRGTVLRGAATADAKFDGAQLEK